MNKLLVLDDNEVDLFIIDKILDKNNLFPNRIMTSDALNAIVTLEQNFNNINKSPDVILMDLIMPKFNGFQFLDRFDRIYSSLQKNIDIYVMTCSIYQKDKEEAKKYPFVKLVMVKPLNVEVLADIYSTNFNLEPAG